MPKLQWKWIVRCPQIASKCLNWSAHIELWRNQSPDNCPSTRASGQKLLEKAGITAGYGKLNRTLFLFGRSRWCETDSLKAAPGRGRDILASRRFLRKTERFSSAFFVSFQAIRLFVQKFIEFKVHRSSQFDLIRSRHYFFRNHFLQFSRVMFW